MNVTHRDGRTIVPYDLYGNESLLLRNALLLDKFEYALDGELYHPAYEMLKLANHLRERLGGDQWLVNEGRRLDGYLSGQAHRHSVCAEDHCVGVVMR